MAEPILADVTKLSERARILMNQMLDRHSPPDSIARTISRKTHEKISWAAIERHANVYASQEQAKASALQGANCLVAEIIRQGGDISDILRASFLEVFARAEATGALYEMNPMALEAAELRRRELELHKKQVSLAERRVKVSERKFKFDREKGRAALQKLERKARCGESLSTDDVEQIRKIYGLYDPSEGPARVGSRVSPQTEAHHTDDDIKEINASTHSGSKVAVL